MPECNVDKLTQILLHIIAHMIANDFEMKNYKNRNMKQQDTIHR